MVFNKKYVGIPCFNLALDLTILITYLIKELKGSISEHFKFITCYNF